MSTAAKTWLIVAAALVSVGMIIFVSALIRTDGDFSKLSSVKYETNTYEISEEFDNISFDTETADIVFSLSDDEKCKVVCHELENIKHSVSVSDGTLTVNVYDKPNWYNHFFVFSFTSPKITVYLPQAEYARLSIKESTGNIDIPKNFKFGEIDISASTGDVKCYASVSGLIKIGLSTGGIKLDGSSAGALDLSVSTGSISVSSMTCEGEIKIKVSTGSTKLSDVTCNNLTSTGSTGTIKLNNVIVAGTMYIKRSTGDIKFDGCDAAEISIKTSTGDVKGSLLTDKIFIAQSNTGSVNVPKTVTGGKCEITTSTGDIKVYIQQ